MVWCIGCHRPRRLRHRLYPSICPVAAVRMLRFITWPQKRSLPYSDVLLAVFWVSAPFKICWLAANWSGQAVLHCAECVCLCLGNSNATKAYSMGIQLLFVYTSSTSFCIYLHTPYVSNNLSRIFAYVLGALFFIYSLPLFPFVTPF